MWLNHILSLFTSKKPKPKKLTAVYAKEHSNTHVWAKGDVGRKLSIFKLQLECFRAYHKSPDGVFALDFTGGAYGSSFLLAAANSVVDALITNIPSDKTILDYVSIINTEDPSIVVEVTDYIREREKIYAA